LTEKSFFRRLNTRSVGPFPSQNGTAKILIALTRAGMRGERALNTRTPLHCHCHRRYNIAAGMAFAVLSWRWRHFASVARL
jgi:hypothetical protein